MSFPFVPQAGGSSLLIAPPRPTWTPSAPLSRCGNNPRGVHGPWLPTIPRTVRCPLGTDGSTSLRLCLHQFWQGPITRSTCGEGTVSGLHDAHLKVRLQRWGARTVSCGRAPEDWCWAMEKMYTCACPGTGGRGHCTTCLLGAQVRHHPTPARKKWAVLVGVPGYAKNVNPCGDPYQHFPNTRSMYWMGAHRTPCVRRADALRIVGRVVVLLPYVDAGTIERTFSVHPWPAPAAAILSYQIIGRRADVPTVDCVYCMCPHVWYWSVSEKLRGKVCSCACFQGDRGAQDATGPGCCE